MHESSEGGAAWRRARRGHRRRNLVAAGGILSVLALGICLMLLPPPAPKPRPGEVLPGGAVVVYSPGYRVSFYGMEHLHPFDIRKYDKIARRLRREGLVSRSAFQVPAEATRDQLVAVHDPSYIDGLRDVSALSRALEVGLPGFLPARSVDRRVLAPFRRAVGGTVAAAEAAREHGLGINLGGGFHHARPDMGHGFCVLNDVAVAIDALRSSGLDGPILIVDTDAHQGDGNHTFFTADPTVITFSIHQGDLFPHPKIPGNLDIELPAGTDDTTYLAELQPRLTQLLDTHQPALVFHVAGSDVLHDDPLTGLALTVDGLVQRDLLVTRQVRTRGIPLVHVLAGGYGPSSAEAQFQSVAAILRGD